MRATNPAIPVWIHKPYRLLLSNYSAECAQTYQQLCLQVLTTITFCNDSWRNYSHQSAKVHHQVRVHQIFCRSWITALVPEKSCNPQIRIYFAGCIHSPGMCYAESADALSTLPESHPNHRRNGIRYPRNTSGCQSPTSTPSLTLVQPWERRALHNKLVHHKVGSQAMKSGRIGHHYPSW